MRPPIELAAETAKALSEAGFLVATGGGLGIMEAGNLGAYFAGRPLEELDAAIDELKRCPIYRGHEAEYIDGARGDHRPPAAGAPSLAVATWRYDEEPISQFATHIAKLFQNSVREEGLLSIADAGVAYFEGGFGTLREIFQDLAQNGAADPPQQMAMVFVDTDGYGARRITLPARPFPRAPRHTAVRRPDQPRRLSRRGRRGDDGRPSAIPPRRMTRAATAGEHESDKTREID